MRAKWLAFTNWREMLPRDVILTLLEAILVLMLSQIPFLFLTIKYNIDNKNAEFSIKTFLFVIHQNVRPGEVLVYISGILSSTTVYFIMRVSRIRYKPTSFLISILGPVILLLSATPTFMADRYDQVANVEFMSNYAISLISIALVLWLYSLFIQRRMENAFVYSGDKSANDLIRQVSGGGN